MDNYPELGYFRNIVYYFKAFMVPTSDALPDLNRWRPAHASLTWSSNKTGTMAVHGFGKELKCSAFIKPGENLNVFSRFVGLFSSKNPRVQPSGGDPSNLVQKDVGTEDDMLHIRHLPDFDSKISARQCELLLQYLTVPYL